MEDEILDDGDIKNEGQVKVEGDQRYNWGAILVIVAILVAPLSSFVGFSATVLSLLMTLAGLILVFRSEEDYKSKLIVVVAATVLLGGAMLLGAGIY